jgi:hypothetical protein
MPKQLLSVVLAASLLFIVSCQKSELSVNSNVEERLSNASRIATQCDVISFNSLPVNSSVINSVTSDGGLVIPMTSYNSAFPAEAHAAMIFNSAAPPAGQTSSYDLGTPNEDYGGPGIGDDGGLNMPYKNDKPLYNILVIKDFDQPTPPKEDDEPGGVSFDFGLAKITPKSITVMDNEVSAESEYGEIRLYASKGGALLKTVVFPDMGQNGVAIVGLGSNAVYTSGVSYIEVTMNGSMGIDDLAFCREMGCSYTQGYWKTHGPVPTGNNSNEWDVNNLTLGTVNYSAMQLLAILNQPVQGNGLLSLAHQLIAAKLNIANGSDGASIQQAISDADVLIGEKVIPPVNGSTTSVKTNTVSTLVSVLDQYNNGVLPGGPSHCD